MSRTRPEPRRTVREEGFEGEPRLWRKSLSRLSFETSQDFFFSRTTISVLVLLPRVELEPILGQRVSLPGSERLGKEKKKRMARRTSTHFSEIAKLFYLSPCDAPAICKARRRDFNLRLPSSRCHSSPPHSTLHSLALSRPQLTSVTLLCDIFLTLRLTRVLLF